MSGSDKVGIKKKVWKSATDQISLIVFHLGRPDQVILLSSPVPKTSEKVIGEETVNGIPDDVYIYRLIYPEPKKKTRVSTTSVIRLIPNK